MLPVAMQFRTLTAIVGVLLSIVVSVAAYWYFDTLFVFLLVPFVPLFFRRRQKAPPHRTCPECSFRTRRTDYEYCPRDGARLPDPDSNTA